MALPNPTLWTVFWVEWPDKRRQNLDTSRGTPKTLIADALLGRKTYLHTASLPLHPGHQTALNLDTSKGTPKTLYADNVILRQPVIQNQVVKRQVVDTSRGTPTVLQLAQNRFEPLPHFAPVRFWWQPPDSSQSTPKTLYTDAFTPTFNYQHTPPDRVRRVTDTSRAEANVLYGDVNIAFVPPSHFAPVRFFWQPQDTSQPLFGGLAVAPPAPFTPAPHYPPPRYWWQPQDTSQSTPTAFSGDAFIAFVPPPHFVPLRFWWQPLDTSQATAKVLYGDAFQAFVNPPQFLVDPVRPVYDTSHGSPAEEVVAPVVPPPHLAPIRALWQPADMSQSMPKVAYSDAFFPVQDYQHTAPDRVRPVTDTTTFEPKALYGDVQIAFTPPPHYTPLRFWWQPQDDSQSTPKPFYADALTFTPVAPQFQVDRIRPVVDTSLSAPLGLLTAAPPAINAPPPQVDRLRPVLDTSQSSPTALIGGTPFSNFQHPVPPRYWWQPLDTSNPTPKVLYADAQRAFIPPPHFAPLRFWWQPADTSQSTPKAGYADVFNTLVNPPQFQVDRIRPVTDTSRGTPSDLIATPFPQIPHMAPIRALWQPADTSQSKPKVTYADAFTPVINVPQYQVDRIRPVTDTSQGTPYELLFFVGRPTVPPPHWAPYRFWWQPLDTSQSTPFPTSFVPPVFTRGNTVRAGIWN
jgi:hypothetical protein